MTEWHTIIQHAKHRVCNPGIIPTHIRASSEENPPNWAGNVALGRGYNEVDAAWTVPCISYSSYRPADTLQWVGLGGDSNDYPNQLNPYHTLVQAGTESGIDSNGFLYNFAWYEIPNYQPSYFRLSSYSFPVYCADPVFVYADSNLTYQRLAYFYIEDYASQRYVGFTDGDGSFATLTDGTTAEWIVERPTDIHKQLEILADFSPGEAQFNAAHTIQSNKNGKCSDLTSLVQ